MHGVCSRRKAEEYITDGKIKVNGRVTTVLGTKINPKRDVIVCEGKRVTNTAEKKCLMLNKPIGYITTTSEQFDRPYVMQLIKEDDRFYPIGRLDCETCGLLLLTNDGELANKIMHPSKKIYKTYSIKVREEITDEMIEQIAKGIDIGDYVTSPAKATILGNDRRILELKIGEGKNRQVRRMCESLGLTVKHLQRTAIGNLTLDKLPIGKYIEVNKNLIRKIFE